jgi:polyferredoxin
VAPSILVLGILGGLAASMATITAVLVKWAAEARTRTSAAVVLFLLGMMVAMLGGALLYFLHPGSTGLVEGLWLASGAMSLTVFPVVLTFLKDAQARMEQKEAYRPTPLRSPATFALGILGLVVLNEFLMGWTFQLAAGTLVPADASSPLNLLTLGVDSPWFILPMAVEMGLSAYFLRHLLPRPLCRLLWLQAALMVLSPPAFGAGLAVTPVTVAGSAGMIALIIYVMELIYRDRQLDPGIYRYLPALLSIYALMMAGLYLWLVYGDGFAFALSVLLEMALFFEAVVRPEQFGGESAVPWLLRPQWAFAVLAAIFVAEVFMGAALEGVLQPSLFPVGIANLALNGSAGTVLYRAFYNGFWFLATVTGSTWFLAMMGIEMGALVVFKLRETRSLETRVRLALLLGSYGAFAVFFPSTYYTAIFPHAPSGTAVPFLGWSMGLGSGPVAPGVFSAILLTYVITGALVVLFGRRAICSVFCTAPLMFQGTTVDAMKSFNRSSPVARKYLSSRLSGLYSVTAGVVMVSLTAGSVLSYLDQVGRLQVTFLGSDPGVFLYGFYFSVVWYLLFVSIPYAGNYNCVTMGWCYTGLIAGAFSRVSFFSLRVRDQEVCRRCKTLDCAKGCPVGLVDMPGHFRRTGVFRSSKCCGVGDCVESCPYDNLYIHDIRHWLRARLRPLRQRSARDLPMAPTRFGKISPSLREEVTPKASRQPDKDVAARPAGP